MLNPSTADEQRNDPTVERCERRARQMGFAGFVVTNIFSWRATDPRDLRKADDPIGPENDSVLCKIAGEADQVISAWGTHGAFLGRGPKVEKILRSHSIKLNHLGLSKEGHPRHPLYVPYARQPQFWVSSTRLTEQ